MNLEFRDSISTAATSSSAGHSNSPAGHSNGGEYPAEQRTTTTKRPSAAGQKLAAEMKIFDQVATELKGKRVKSEDLDERCSQVLREAVELFGLAPTWTAFYRETVGMGGAVRDLFKGPDEMQFYEESDAHEKVLEMITALRSRELPDCDPSETQRMITVRIPKSLHDSICQEANDLKASVNKLCITRLLQPIDRTLIPASTQKRRGRRPGAEYARVATDETDGDCNAESTDDCSDKESRPDGHAVKRNSVQ